MQHKPECGFCYASSAAGYDYLSQGKTSADCAASIRRLAGIKPGDRLEFKASRGIITIISQSQVTLAGETPEQRRIIDAQLVEGLDDIRKGRVSRRFDTVEEMLASLKGPSPRIVRHPK